MSARPFFALLVLLFVSGCARHVVVPRDAGRVDAARSITTMSDTDWQVQREPSGAKDGRERTAP